MKSGFLNIKLSSPQGSDEENDSRRRITLACLRCRTRKIRCDGAADKCSKCDAAGARCQYLPVTKEENQAARDKKATSKLKRTTSTPGPFSPASPASATSPSPTTPSRSLKRKAAPSTPQPPRFNRRYTEPANVPEPLSLNIMPELGTESTYALPQLSPATLWSAATASGPPPTSYHSTPFFEITEESYHADEYDSTPSFYYGDYQSSSNTSFPGEDESMHDITPMSAYPLTPGDAVVPKYLNYEEMPVDYPSPPTSDPATSPTLRVAPGHANPEHIVQSKSSMYGPPPALSRSYSVPYLQHLQQNRHQPQPEYVAAAQGIPFQYQVAPYPPARPLFPDHSRRNTIGHGSPSQQLAQPSGLCIYIDPQQQQYASHRALQSVPIHTPPHTPTAFNTSGSPYDQPTAVCLEGPIDWNTIPLRPFPSSFRKESLQPSLATSVPVSSAVPTSQPLGRYPSMHNFAGPTSQPLHRMPSIASIPQYPSQYQHQAQLQEDPHMASFQTVSMDQVCNSGYESL